MSRGGSDVGFMFIAYNLRRIGNILTREVLREYLRTKTRPCLNLLKRGQS